MALEMPGAGQRGREAEADSREETAGLKGPTGDVGGDVHGTAVRVPNRRARLFRSQSYRMVQ